MRAARRVRVRRAARGSARAAAHAHGRFRWGRCACDVLADRGADPRNPGYGTGPRREAKTAAGAAHPRSAAPVNGAVRPPLRGGVPESQGWCAAYGARHTTPTSGPAADRRPGHRAPSGRDARLARGSDPGRGGAAGMAARVRLTGDHPHGVAGMGRECGSRATTPTLCSGATPRWCCGAAPRWCSDVTPTWCRDATRTWCRDVTPASCWDAIPT
jgi:hypothetical protein